MEYILSEFGDNLLRYYDKLRSVGGTKANEPYRLLVVSFLDDFMQSGMSTYINEKDYKAIDKALNCLTGDCLMPFHEWKNIGTVNERGFLSGGLLALENGDWLYALERFMSVYRTEGD